MSDEVSINEVHKKLTKGVDIRADAELMMEPYNNWEEKIMPAPYTICVLGQLLIISSSSMDFPLEKPIGGFKHVRWPDSFRASLAQVSGEGYKAFNLAHQCMDEIQMATSQVPQHMISSVTILSRGNDWEVQNTLPKILGSIQSIADRCKQRSEEVANKFQSVMDLILELQQSTVATKASSEQQIREIETQIKVQQIHKEQLDEQKNMYKETYAKADKDLNKCMKDYDKALSDIPGAGELFGLALLDAATNVISGISSTLSFGKSSSKNNSTSTRSSQSKAEKPKGITYEDAQIYSLGMGLMSEVEKLGQYFDENGMLVSINATGNAAYQLRFLTSFFKMHKDRTTIQNGDQRMKKSIIDICDMASMVCDKIKELDGNNSTEGAVRQLFKDISEVSEQSQLIHARCSEAQLTDLLNGSVPNASKHNFAPVSDSLSKQQVKNAHFKVEMASERLEKVEKRFEEAAQRMRKTNEEMTTALSKLAEFDAQNASHTQIIEVLKEGVKQLGILQEQWSQLSMFFEHIANLISLNLTSNMKMFVEYSKDAREQQLKGYRMSEAMRDVIYKTTFEAVKYASLVNHLSSGYWQVSDKYLMGSISSLGKLLQISDDKGQVQREQQRLLDDCEATQRAIQVLIQNHTREFKEKVASRLSAIKNEFSNVLPPLGEADTQKLKDTARKGVEEAPKRPVAMDIKDELDHFA